MISNWHNARLGDVATIIGRGITPRYSDDGATFVLNQRCVRDGRLNLELARRHNSVSKPVPEGKLLHPGDLLVNSTGVGTLGRTAPVKVLSEPTTADSHLTIIRPKEGIDARWLGYALRLSEPEIEAMAEGSTGQTELSRHRLALLDVVVPPLVEQRAIAATLGALDDKIESNRRTLGAGETLIRSLVQKVLSTSEGKSGTLGDYCELIKTTVKTNEIDESTNYVGLEHMPRGSIFLPKWTLSEGLSSHKSVFRAGDMLFGKLRPYFKKVGIAPVDGICSTDILVIRVKNPADTLLVACVAASDALIDSITASATGTRMPRASWNDIATWPLPLLSPHEREALAAQVFPVYKRLEHLIFESLQLTSLRDALLPELLSGRIRVPAKGVEA